MNNKIISKLFPPHQSIKILQCKQETILPKICSEKKCICSFKSDNLKKHASHSQGSNSLPMKKSLIRNCPVCSPYLGSRFIQCNLSIQPDLDFLRKCNRLGVQPFDLRRALMHTGNNKLLLCTSGNVKALWNKSVVISNGRPYQGQIQLYTQKTEVQPVVSKGVGWAGQPIVKRTHAILPEIFGDVSDVFTASNQPPSSEDCESNLKQNDSTLKFENSNTLDQKSDPIEPTSSECLHENSNVELDDSCDQNTVQSSIKSHHNISLMNSYNKLNSSKENERNEVKQTISNLVGQGFHNNYFNITEHKEDVKPKIIMKTLKSKLKKRSRVVGVKGVKGLNKVTMIRKKKEKVFGPKRTHKSTQLALCQQNKCDFYNSKTVLLTENRQLTTSTVLSYPRTSTSLNKKATLPPNKNKEKASRRAIKRKKEIASDDCVCPTTIEIKQRDSTKVCGEAGEGEKKEKKKRKQKMCIIAPVIKYRQKTFVCASAAQKGGRKRQLPKCPEPEKKIALKTKVCPPQLDEAKAVADKCVKQVEEVKIRKRSKVCKPVIIYAKEEASVKIEKAVCVESRVKQTVSKHTKVCTPSNDKKSRSKAKY